MNISSKVTKALPGFTIRISPRKVTRTTAFVGKTALNIGGTARPKTPRKVIVGVSKTVAVKAIARPISGKPYGAFRDFGFHPNGLLDPAKVLVNGKLAGVTANNGTDMRRIWMTVTPPQEYRVSKNSLLWPRAAFASVGVRFKDMAANGYQYIDGAQVEVSPRVAVGPSVYSPARALGIVVHADTMNYVTNPQTNRVVTTGNSATTSITTVDGKYYAGSVAVTAPKGATFEVYLKDTVNTTVAYSHAITMPASGLPARVSIPALAPVNGTTCTLYFRAIAGGTVTFSQPRLDRVSGPGALRSLSYLDGSLGTDYLWAGAANNSPSFYYRDRQARSYLLNRVLLENCPLGVIPAVPRFAVLPTQ